MSGCSDNDSNNGIDIDAGPTSDIDVDADPDTDADIVDDTGPDADDLDPWGDESGDGIPNRFDNCPDHYNPDQQDRAGDGVGDVCDNCPDHANPDQEYSEDNPVDERGIIMGDACAPGVTYADAITDSSGDGVPDIMDNCPEDQNPPLEVGCDCPPDDTYCDECTCTCPDDIYPCSDCEQLDSSGDGVGDACDNCPDHYNPNQTASPDNPDDDRGITMGDACAPEPNDSQICQTQEFEFYNIKPNLYVALDLSGSIGESGLGLALDALDLVAEEVADEVRFGLGVFPQLSGGSCEAGHLLDISEYPASELKSTWEDFISAGHTPLYASVTDIRDNNRLDDDDDDFDDERVKAVLLVTDTLGNCSGEDSQQNVINALGDLYDQGILTFLAVSGLYSGQDIDAFANAGGTGEETEHGGPLHIGDADGLVEAMSNLPDLAVSCSYTLDSAPEDKNRIWIEVNNDYYLDTDDYDYEAEDNTVTLSDDACDALRDSDVDEIQIEIKMGCASQCEVEEPQGLCDLWYETCGEEELCDSCEPEVCDGTDNNCSGTVDDGCPDCAIFTAPCAVNSDCCDSFVCNSAGHCDRPCYPDGTACRSNSDCCNQTCAKESGDEVGLCAGP